MVLFFYFNWRKTYFWPQGRKWHKTIIRQIFWSKSWPGLAKRHSLKTVLKPCIWLFHHFKTNERPLIFEKNQKCVSKQSFWKKIHNTKSVSNFKLWKASQILVHNSLNISGPVSLLHSVILSLTMAISFLSMLSFCQNFFFFPNAVFNNFLTVFTTVVVGKPLLPLFLTCFFFFLKNLIVLACCSVFRKLRFRGILYLIIYLYFSWKKFTLHWSSEHFFVNFFLKI